MNTTHLTDALRSGLCPGCGCRCLIAGPWGGGSRNVYCPACLTIWNLHGVDYGVVFAERSGAATLELIAHAIATYGQLWRGLKHDTANRDTGGNRGDPVGAA